MWISEKEIYCHVLNVERCAQGQDTKKQKECGGMETACFTHAMYIAVVQEYGVTSIRQK